MSGITIQDTVTICPVCNERNDFLDIRCCACGAYIRDRVPSIHLFHTLWLLLETPGIAFLRVARSEQKNYVFVLFALSGPFLASLMLFALSAGSFHPRFESLLGLLLIWGLPTGLAVNTAVSVCIMAFHSKSFGVRLSYRNASALQAFAVAPLVLASVVFLPVALALFGNNYFFPLPQLYKPIAFWLLACFQIACILWSVYLTVRYQSALGESNMIAVLKAGVAVVVFGIFIALESSLLKLVYFS
jgi:hypothetical protein